MADKAEKKAPSKPEVAATAPAEETSKKRKKINDLTLAEIEARLAQCREKQGSLTSKYACQLLARKKSLTS